MILWSRRPSYTPERALCLGSGELRIWAAWHHHQAERRPCGHRRDVRVKNCTLVQCACMRMRLRQCRPIGWARLGQAERRVRDGWSTSDFVIKLSCFAQVFSVERIDRKKNAPRPATCGAARGGAHSSHAPGRTTCISFLPGTDDTGSERHRPHVATRDESGRPHRAAAVTRQAVDSTRTGHRHGGPATRFSPACAPCITRPHPCSLTGLPEAFCGALHRHVSAAAAVVAQGSLQRKPGRQALPASRDGPCLQQCMAVSRGQPASTLATKVRDSVSAPAIRPHYVFEDSMFLKP